MKRLITAGSLWVAFTLPSHAQMVPALQAGPPHRLVLPAAMWQALDAAHPHFRVWQLSVYTPDIQSTYAFSSHQAPWAVLGDFNGDSVPDLVVDGHANRRAFRLCLLSDRSPAGFTVLTLLEEQISSPGTKASALIYQAPAHFSGEFENSPLDLHTDAFHDAIWEKASTLYYWLDGSFHEYTSGD